MVANMQCKRHLPAIQSFIHSLTLTIGKTLLDENARCILIGFLRRIRVLSDHFWNGVETENRLDCRDCHIRNAASLAVRLCCSRSLGLIQAQHADSCERNQRNDRQHNKGNPPTTVKCKSQSTNTRRKELNSFTKFSTNTPSIPVNKIRKRHVRATLRNPVLQAVAKSETYLLELGPTCAANPPISAKQG